MQCFHAEAGTSREAKAPQPVLRAISLQRLLEAEAKVFILLLNGTRMQGFIGGFDNQTGLLEQHAVGMQLFHKQGIASIVPKAVRQAGLGGQGAAHGYVLDLPAQRFDRLGELQCFSFSPVDRD